MNCSGIFRRTASAFVISLAAAAMAGGAQAQEEAQAPLLPGGASSLTETHGDWVVRCQVTTREDAPARNCSMNQRRTTQEGQQILTAELLRPSEDQLEGAIVLPFGLAVTEQIRLMVDEAADSLAELTFSTCLQNGCVVFVSLDASALAALRAGSELRVHAFAPQNEEFVFPISLTGFTAAVNRLTELGE